MKKGSTNFLRFVVFVLGLGVLAMCIFALPNIWQGGSVEYPAASQALFLIIAGLYATAVPFYAALWQTFKLLRYIDENRAFSDLSVKALRKIKYCATIIAIIYIGFVPLLAPIAEADDAPGLLLMGVAIAGAPIVVAVFAAVLEKLLRDAIALKSENDLTI